MFLQVWLVQMEQTLLRYWPDQQLQQMAHHH